MKSILRVVFGIIITTLSINLQGQKYPMIVIGIVESIEFDRITYKQQEFEDSVRLANATFTYDTLENGAIVSTGPSIAWRMSNPYNLIIKIEKSFSSDIQNRQINVRIWEHENPDLFLNHKKPFAFVLANSDFYDIYPVYDYYRVFKTWTGKWAEPVHNREKIYPKAKKAIFGYKLLKEKDTQYYQLITDELDCCIDQLQTLYSINKEKTNK